MSRDDLSRTDPQGERDATFDLRPASATLVLEPTGFRYPLSFRRRSVLTPYSAITHLAVGPRGLWIGLDSGVVLLRRSRFRGGQTPELLVRELVTRISRLPLGIRQLARFAEIDQLARRAPPRRLASSLLAVVCAAIYALEMLDPFVQDAGAFVPDLVRQGELWRILTANLLHAVPVHLATNLLGIFVFAHLVERPLGSLRTAFVMGVSAIASMAGSAVADYGHVVGASGVVLGMAGATLCLELHFPHRLPAWWRLPRRFFITLLVLEGIFGFAVPFVAGAAHLGGFAGGYLATRLVAGSALTRSPVESWVKGATAALGVAVALALLAATPLVLRNPSAFARYGQHLLAVDWVQPGQLNDAAWRMATEVDASPDQLEVAVALAERAVEETGRMNPDLLDTLAEVHFQRGDTSGAVDVIDEALALVRAYETYLGHETYAGGDYFREQRRRFTGERAPDDRPAPPPTPWPFPDPPTPEGGEPGIEV